MSGRETAVKRARLIREVLLDYGVPEVSIEVQAGRPVPAGRDPWNSLDPVGVTSHHIASRPTVAIPTPGLRLVKQGRGGVSPLGGPLANGHAGVDLVYRIITLGWANHPGYGGPLTVHGPLGAFTIPEDNGRPYLWGTEYEGGYTDEVWDRVYTNKRTKKRMDFREFMGRSNAALCEAIWLPGISSRGLYDRIEPGMDLSGYHLEHKSWAPGRKPDRRNYTTESGRDEVRRYATKEDELDMNKQQFQDWVATTPLPVKVGADDERRDWTLGQHLQHNEQEIDAVKRMLNQLLNRDADSLAEKIAARLAITADSEVVKQAVKDALAEGVTTGGE